MAVVTALDPAEHVVMIFDVGPGIVQSSNPGIYRVTNRQGQVEEFTSSLNDFVYDVDGRLIGGTITGWSHPDFGGGFSVTGLNFPAASLPAGLGEALLSALLSDDDKISGSDTGDYLKGFGGNDSIVGNGSEDSLDGGNGADTMQGGAGSDTYFVDNAKDVVSETANAGTERVFSSVGYTLPSDVEHLTLLGDSNLDGAGNGLNNVVQGNGAENEISGLDGDDLLIGSDGDDTLSGGDGNDTLAGDAGDGGAGIDIIDLFVTGVTTGVVVTLVQSPDETTLDATGVGLGVDKYKNMEGVKGTVAADLLIGSSSGDFLDGGGGNDTMRGGKGDDTLDGAHGLDPSVMDLSDGTAAVSVTLSDSADYVTLNLTAAGLGTDKYRKMEGIIGTSFNDTLSGNDANNQLFGGAGNDKLIGGGDGFDTLDGGTGADTMAGGFAHDVYHVDDAGDVVVETAEVGEDKVYSSISYKLGANVEDLVLTGNGAIDGTGNDLNNRLDGNSGNNVLTGFAGFDFLMGGAGDDTMDGGAGHDIMDGGAGDDVYFVDDTTDNIGDFFNQGYDTVYASADFRLTAQTEQLILIGAAKQAWGNELDNKIFGTEGDNSLAGFAGADTLDGGLGNDTLQGGFGNDTIEGGEGFDILAFGVDKMVNEGPSGGVELTLKQSGKDTTVDLTAIGLGKDTYRNIEGVSGSEFNDTLTGSGAADLLLGDKGDDSLTGAGGDDTLDGGGIDGSDTLAGGDGADLLRNVFAGLMTGDGGNDTLTGAGTATLDGGTGDDSLFGEQGGLLMVGGGGADRLEIKSGIGSDTLLGGDDADVLICLSGDDVLDGGVGDDTMIGGLGNDVFHLDSFKDVVVETKHDTEDLVVATISLTGVIAGVENYDFSNAPAVKFLADSAANEIVGSAFADTIDGADGNDELFGGNGNDSLIGGKGNDYLNGEGDDDSLYGGLGDDTYFLGGSNDFFLDEDSML